METYCAANTNVTTSKYRSTTIKSNNFYHNVNCTRNLRPIGNDYSVPTCNRRSTISLHNPWQERISPHSCIDRKPSRGKLCSIVLAIASFLVLIAVLSIAGLALYMGALHSEQPNSILTFSCSAKITRGDRFIGGLLQEKLRKYKLQLENLYQKSVLGPALVFCTVERFGNDTLTIFFKLGFNKKKLNSRNLSNIEKTIRDILLTDAISRKPIFRNIRFDPRSIQIKEIDSTYQRNTVRKIFDSNTNKTNSKSGVVLKSQFRSNVTTNLPTIKKKLGNDEIDIKEEELPVIQGSFKISKTDADITEKKTETTTFKPKSLEKLTTLPNKKSTLKETSVTSALYKIAAIEKVPVTTTTTTSSTSPEIKLDSTTDKSSTLFMVINPQIFDEEPWIPILPNNKAPIIASSTTPQTTTLNKKEPIYASFTNPGLSFHTLDTEQLGSTKLKSHPIPVNKIPEITEPSTFQQIEETTPEEITTNSSINNEKPLKGFVEVETVQYIPGSINNTKLKQEQILKNISSIFHSLVSSLADVTNINLTSTTTTSTEQLQEEEERKEDNEASSGTGHVEVVEGDEATLIMQTTKLPLVTLIPVKSNSGIGRPLRKRPSNATNNNLLVENRSFPGSTSRFNNLNDNPIKLIETEVVTSISSEINKIKMDKNHLDDIKIVGLLNFATDNQTDNSHLSELIRNPKMEPPLINVTQNFNEDDNSEIVVYVTNSSKSTNREKQFNILTPEKLKQLSEISKLHDNLTNKELPDVISTKAISSNSYTVNHSGFKILTKTFNKINEFPTTNKDKIDNYSFTIISNTTTTKCANSTIKCGDGQCLPETTKCNQLIDCNDGKDEQNCNCVDYLKSQYLLKKICDGVVDCWDYSDENQCEWCQPNQYVCGNSKVCINKNKICDGLRDCPQGDDERQCVTIASSLKTANDFPYYSEGYLMVRKYGEWGKLCTENFQNVVTRSQISWEISDLGKAVCKSMTYQNLDSIQETIDVDQSQNTKYFELTYSFQNKSKSSLSFKETNCDTKQIIKVNCETLECGARPQAVKHIARIVGGGNAGLGSWPWQAALYKEGEFQCGATLLSDKWLISAGHCFYHSLEEHWVARLGTLRRGTTLPSPYEQLRPIIRIIVHPGYVDSGFINDISLLQMEFPVTFSDYVRPICLPVPEQPAIDGKLCTVVGWGQLFEVGRIFPDTLQEVQVPVISTAECRKRTVFLPLYKITDDMFCAGYERGGRDACLGDSGGPLMCPESNGRWILQGITSNGYGCARANRPGVYTKVENYVPWIQTYMTEKSTNLTNIIKNVCLGHRCPLGECLPKSRLCNGYIECSDGSDERDC